jgi:hypothetical protein
MFIFLEFFIFILNIISSCMSLILSNIKDTYFLDHEITSGAGYYLSQVKYGSNQLSRTDLTNSKITSNPLETNVELLLLMLSLYQMPPSTCSWPAILSISVTWPYSVPHSTHYDVLRILHHIKRTLFIWSVSFKDFDSLHIPSLTSTPIPMQIRLVIPHIHCSTTG